MKELHLVCNAHIDPCWQWDVEEGIACTLSTFRCAADFCEEYDTLIFNHNEALLYQWVEEYEPKLFERIKKLVSKGRWHIMGGWYLQPDCNLPSGESFVRQILKGRMYFKEKFNAVPAAAVNVDSFGHTRGLVQILKKSGYDSYVFCRPFHKNMPLEADDFIWKGYDGSEIRAFRTYGIYNSLYGMAESKIREWMEVFPKKDTGCVFWGVGDHGGGPSRIDLDAISKLQSQLMDRKIIHSTPETYFNKTGESGRALPVWDKGLNHWGPGCYTSMVRIKQKHRQLESLYYMAEKMAVHVAIAAGMAYPEQAFDEALKALMFAQFHDILPGTAIRAVEETGIRKLDYGLELMREVTSKCFFALCRGQKKARDGEIPVLIYNPHPYAVEGIFECEFMLANMNVSGTFMNPVVYQGDLRLPSQCEKEESNFPMDWRKKVVFQAVLRPGQINRFDVRLEEMESELSRNKLDVIHLADKFLQPDKKFDFHVNGLSLPLKMPFGKPEPNLKETDGYLNFSGIHYHGKINCKTGYMEFLSLEDEVIFSGPSVVPIVFQDTMDSWAGDMTGFQCEKGRFTLASDKAAARMAGTKGPLSPVRVVEDGEVRTVVEASMVYGGSSMCITYSLPKKDKAIEISFKVCWNEKDAMLKAALPVCFPVAACTAQTSYGSEMTERDGHEAYMQQWCGLWGDRAGMTVVNNGIYGFNCKDNILYITLLRSPAYAAHPSPSPAIQCAADYSNIPRMDQGEQFFSFRIIADSSDRLKAGISRYAQAFNEKPYVLSFFPEGPEAVTEPFMHLSQDSSILAGAFKKAENDNGYILRLFEAAGLPGETRVDIPALGIKQKAVLKPFEIRTYRCTENKMEVCSLMEEQAEGDGILRLMENRVRRMYRGGAGIEKIHGRTPLDSDCPEEWIGSVVEAGNSEMQPVNREGISKVNQNGACKYLDEVLAENPDYYLGKAHYEALGLTTGVLVKFLDSAMRLALQAHMVITLTAGCNSSGSNDTGQGEAVKQETKDETQKEENKGTGDQVIELSFPNIWVGNDSKAEVFGKMVDGFNTEYEGKYKIKVEEQTDYDAYRDKIRTQMSTGNPPDIFTFDDRGSLELYSKSGKLMDLTEFLQEEDMKSRFQEGQIEKARIDGINYAFPYESAVIPMMFNNRLLKEAGAGQVPQTFEEFWEVCEKLKAKDIIPVCQMTNNNAIFSVYWYSYLLAALGGEKVFENGLDDPAFLKAAEYMQKMFEYSSSDAIGADATVANGHFFNERAAIYANGTWILGRIKSEGVEGLYDNIVISPGLSIDGKNGGAYLSTTQAYFAAARQDDPAREEAVKAFFRYITEPERVVELADSSGALFAVNIDASKLSDKLQGEVVKQSSQASFQIGHFNSEMPTTVVNAFPAALEGLILGDLTPAQFVEQLKAAQE